MKYSSLFKFKSGLLTFNNLNSIGFCDNDHFGNHFVYNSDLKYSFNGLFFNHLGVLYKTFDSIFFDREVLKLSNSFDECLGINRVVLGDEFSFSCKFNNYKDFNIFSMNFDVKSDLTVTIPLDFSIPSFNKLNCSNYVLNGVSSIYDFEFIDSGLIISVNNSGFLFNLFLSGLNSDFVTISNHFVDVDYLNTDSDNFSKVLSGLSLFLNRSLSIDVIFDVSIDSLYSKIDSYILGGSSSYTVDSKMCVGGNLISVAYYSSLVKFKQVSLLPDSKFASSNNVVCNSLYSGFPYNCGFNSYDELFSLKSFMLASDFNFCYFVFEKYFNNFTLNSLSFNLNYSDFNSVDSLFLFFTRFGEFVNILYSNKLLADYYTLDFIFKIFELGKLILEDIILKSDDNYLISEFNLNPLYSCDSSSLLSPGYYISTQSLFISMIDSLINFGGLLLISCDDLKSYRSSVLIEIRSKFVSDNFIGSYINSDFKLDTNLKSNLFIAYYFNFDLFFDDLWIDTFNLYLYSNLNYMGLFEFDNSISYFLNLIIAINLSKLNYDLYSLIIYDISNSIYSDFFRDDFIGVSSEGKLSFDNCNDLNNIFGNISDLKVNSLLFEFEYSE